MGAASFEPETSILDDVAFEVVHHDSRTTIPIHPIYLPIVKRLLDIVGSLVFMLVLSPVILASIVLILRDSPGSVIFRQTRLGKHCQPFICYKFRSMVTNAEEILIKDHHLLASYALNWKLISDPRVTRFGRFIRRTSIDELPQLINVLKGNMSLVGPRPYMPSELADEFGHYSAAITSVKPGMTGLWQVSGRALLSPSQRIQLDAEYAQQCSIGLDIRIAIRTLRVVFRGIGAM